MSTEFESEPYIARPRLLEVTLMILVLALGLTFFLWPRAVVMSTVRLRNSSTIPFSNVVMGRHSYGNLGAGALSDYQTWGPVYSDEHLEFDAGGTHFARVPDDYYGESPLGPGRFTFSIVLEPTERMVGFVTELHHD